MLCKQNLRHGCTTLPAAPFSFLKAQVIVHVWLHEAAQFVCMYICAPASLLYLSLSLHQFLLSLPGSVSSASSQSSGFSEASAATPSGSGGQKDYGGLDFKIVVDFKNGSQATIHLVAPSMQEKAAWTSDISQVCSC